MNDFDAMINRSICSTCKRGEVEHQECKFFYMLYEAHRVELQAARLQERENAAKLAEMVARA
jgi:hypothetical protein